MRVGIATLQSLSPYSQSQIVQIAKLPKELMDDFDKRTWRDHLHVNANGHVFIPPMAFKKSLTTAAGYLSIKIPGEGTAKFTRHIQSGVLVVEGLELPLTPADAIGERLFLNADGRSGGNKRVFRTYPRINEWQGIVRFYILDDKITNDVLERCLREAGSFIGIGRFRPEKGGYYGRYAVNKIEWTEE